MIIRVNEIKVPVDLNVELIDVVGHKIGLPKEYINRISIIRRSVDARDKNRVLFVYTIDVFLSEKGKSKKIKGRFELIDVKENKEPKKIYDVIESERPFVIGSGPAGMFAALALAESGLRPIVIERGQPVDIRKKDVTSFWDGNNLKIESNVQFGEGGAGAFSDGKLTTGIKSEYCAKILLKLVEHGAPESILYDAKPHIGTDRLYDIIKRIREYVIKLGGEYKFNTKLSNITTKNNKLHSIILKNDCISYEVEAKNVILAIGHSARDTFEMLLNEGVNIKQKQFSVGVRIEHKQQWIDEIQYGKYAKHINEKSKLGAADYKIVAHLTNGRGVYTFCMCPGGFVIAAASEENRIVTNGMSYLARDGENANAALLVGVSLADFGSNHPLAGMYYQQNLEETAFSVSGDYKAPSQRVGDFLKNRPTVQFSDVIPTYRPGVIPCNISDYLPSNITESLRLGILDIDKKLKGFAASDAVLTAVESRSSSPITIIRDDSMQSNIGGLYPCGEGAGYAGGIMSAAVDGMKCADKCIHSFC